MMMENPERCITRYAPVVDTFLFHPGTCSDWPELKREIRGLGRTVGLALLLGEDWRAYRDDLAEVDVVLVMGTEVGIKGVDINSDVYAVISELREHIDAHGYACLIQGRRGNPSPHAPAADRRRRGRDNTRVSVLRLRFQHIPLSPARGPSESWPSVLATGRRPPRRPKADGLNPTKRCDNAACGRFPFLRFHSHDARHRNHERRLGPGGIARGRPRPVRRPCSSRAGTRSKARNLAPATPKAGTRPDWSAS